MICDKRKRVLYIVTEIEVLNQLSDASSVKREMFLIKDLRRTERTYKKAMAVDIETMGDNLLPTLFSIFINDLVQEINDLNLGVDLLETKLSLLLYADDIALVANSAEDLQCMLNTLHQWCKRWRELINTDKSKCIHFRKPRTKETNFEFTVGKNKLEKVENYKYLGVTFGHNENFITNAENLSKGDGRALWKMIFKIHNSKDFGFYAYEKLYYSCVVPILEYASSVWGYRKFQTIDNIQNRTIRYFLGVHRFAPTLALHGDVRWIPSQFRRWTNMVRY
ncbi:Hypothetical predicted protein [Mytilus galloprovincialis]|uniref:Reverse transcriptase domain-containing protein n=1 Tax=Mytilus galloprovincialis TaxID=29158 RepID=A0A8B6CQV8_MYTGA|nr:Hypothetical predicted protein [Mytilus galloprovincialis]